MKSRTKKIVGITAIGAMTLVELIQLQQANAAPVTFTGSLQADGHFGSNVQVAITVDTVNGKYQITGITTPVQPTGTNGYFASMAIPTLTTEALAAQSANIAGVSGASSISAGWIASLASAIASAAAAGETIGTVPGSTTPAPTPTGTTPPPTPKPTTAPVDPAAAVLAKLVTAGTITQAQATIILAALQAAHVSRPNIGGSDDAGTRGGGAEGSSEHRTSAPAPTPTSTGTTHTGIGQTLRLSIAQDLSVITTTLGITASQLQADFAAGQSLATIAGTKTPALITAIVAAETTRINARVKPGGLTQAQATALIAGLTAAVTTEVNAVPTKGGRGLGLPTGYGALYAAPAKHK